MISPKDEEEVSALLYGGEEGPKRYVFGPQLEGGSDLTLALGVSFCSFP